MRTLKTIGVRFSTQELKDLHNYLEENPHVKLSGLVRKLLLEVICVVGTPRIAAFPTTHKKIDLGPNEEMLPDGQIIEHFYPDNYDPNED